MVRPATSGLTAAQEILLGAKALDDQGRSEFSEWDLTVAVWKRSKNRFGCRGYEQDYPDHKRVMMEIMGATKKENPLRRGWIKKTRPNYYSLTDLGRGEAERLVSRDQAKPEVHRSAQPIYDAVAPYFNHSVFRKYCRDPSEPKMWLGAASFLGVTRNDRQHLEDRIRLVKSSIAAALAWLDDIKADQLNRGVTGGGVAITRSELRRLEAFVSALEERFSVQIDAIRRSRP